MENKNTKILIILVAILIVLVLGVIAYLVYDKISEDDSAPTNINDVDNNENNATEENVQEMKKNGRVVLLTASPQTVYDRVKDNNDRPILAQNKNVEFIADLMEKRREKYEAAADVVVQTDGKSVLEICEELIKKLLEMDES